MSEGTSPTYPLSTSLPPSHASHAATTACTPGTWRTHSVLTSSHTSWCESCATRGNHRTPLDAGVLDWTDATVRRQATAEPRRKVRGAFLVAVSAPDALPIKKCRKRQTSTGQRGGKRRHLSPVKDTLRQASSQPPRILGNAHVAAAVSRVGDGADGQMIALSS